MSTEKTISGSWIVDEISKMHINSIPQAWYKTIRQKKAPHAMAILILWELLYWYKWTEIRDEQSDRVIGYKKKFKADLLQRSYGDIAEKFGITKRQATDILYFLRDEGIVTLNLRTLNTNGMKVSNVLFIGLNPKKIAEISDERNLIDTEESDSTNENYVKLSTEESNSSNEISLEGSRNSDRQIQSLTQTNSQTNTQSTSQSISSPQPSESSDKDSLPQEENSKSHYEPFSPSEETPSDSEPLPKRKRNSKSHCGSATEEKETSEFKQVKDLYLKNYNTLVEQKVFTAQKFSQKQWQSFGVTINQNIAKYGLESVLKILTNSFDDDFCRRSGYILTTIFHTNIAPRLLVAPNYYPNSFNKQSSTPRSYQQPRQFDENHLIF